MFQKKLFVITCRNVEKSISHVISAFEIEENYNFFNEILIIDNKSNDKTIYLINDFLKKFNENNNKIKLHINEKNIGYGGSVKFAFDYAVNNDFDTISIHHGDNQTSTNIMIQRIIENFNLINDNSIIIASRFINKEDTEKFNPFRRYGNFYFRWFTKILTGLSLSDPGAALCTMPVQILKKIDIKKLDTNFMFHPQLNLKLYENNISFNEFPIQWSDSSDKGDINLIKYGLQLKLFLIKWKLKKILKL